MSNENMELVRKAMEAHQKTQLGGDFTEGVPIDFVSYEGNRYSGVVVFKKPNMGDYLRMGAIKADLLKKAGVDNLSLVDDSVKFMAHCIATLTVVATKRPQWLLKMEDVREPDVIYHVHAKYEVWENSFRKPIQGDAATDSETSEGEKPVDAAEARLRGDSSDRSEDTSNDGRAGGAGDGAPSAG